MSDGLMGTMCVQIGYRAINRSYFRPLTWHASRDPGAKVTDGTWGCPDAAQPYPAMHHSLVHPCTSAVQDCCGLAQASFDLRFRSFFAAPKGMLLMAYEVFSSASHSFTRPVRMPAWPPHCSSVGLVLHLVFAPCKGLASDGL